MFDSKTGLMINSACVDQQAISIQVLVLDSIQLDENQQSVLNYDLKMTAPMGGATQCILSSFEFIDLSRGNF